MSYYRNTRAIALGRLLKAKRRAAGQNGRGLTLAEVVARFPPWLKLGVAQLNKIEHAQRRSPFWEVQEIARALDLDVATIAKELDAVTAAETALAQRPSRSHPRKRKPAQKR